MFYFQNREYISTKVSKILSILFYLIFICVFYSEVYDRLSHTDYSFKTEINTTVISKELIA